MRGAVGAPETSWQKVRNAARELGHRPDSRARLLRSSRTKLLGLNFSSSQPFHAEIVDAAYAEAAARGYEIAPAWRSKPADTQRRLSEVGPALLCGLRPLASNLCFRNGSDAY